MADAAITFLENPSPADPMFTPQNMAMQAPTFVPPQFPSGMPAFQSERLSLKIAEAMIDTEKTREKLRIRDEFKTKNILRFVTIVRNLSGEILIGMTDPDYRVIRTRPLLDAKNLHAEILFAHQCKRRVLNIKWDNDQLFLLEDDEQLLKHFEKGLLKKGVNIFASRTILKEAEKALLSDLITHASEKEIPRFRGWNLMSDEHWVFAKDPLQIMEVIINEF